ncbi:MAG: hypothetical protein ACRDWD_04430 [Acidimicrobiia bacterium]
MSTTNEAGSSPNLSTRPGTGVGAYALVAAIASVPLVMQTIRADWSLDVWQHAAAILELSSHPFDPRHPTVAVTVGHPDLSPYSLLWGLAHRLTGAHVLTVLTVAGLVNLAAIWLGLWVAARRLTRARLAPAFAVPALLLVWGYRPWRWSGYPSFKSIGFGLPYPSFFAFAAYLIGLAVLIDWLREPRWSRAWILAALGATMTLSHPITGAAFGVAVVALLAEAVIGGRAPAGPAFAQLAPPAAVALVALLVWPFFSISSLFDNAGSYSDANARVLESILPRAGLAFACLPVVVLLCRRRNDWRLLVLAIPPLVLVGVGVVIDSPALGRLLPFGLLPVQLAVADVVAGAFSPSATRRDARLIFGAGVAAIGAVGVATALSHMVPSPLLPASIADDDRLNTARDDADAVDCVPSDAVVIAPEGHLAWPALASGAKLVVPPNGAPEVDDTDEREAAVEEFLLSPLSRQRQIAEQYNATHVLLSASAADQVDVEQLGTVECRTDDVVLIRL